MLSNIFRCIWLSFVFGSHVYKVCHRIFEYIPDDWIEFKMFNSFIFSSLSANYALFIVLTMFFPKKKNTEQINLPHNY